METLKFKTNIKCAACVAKVTTDALSSELSVLTNCLAANKAAVTGCCTHATLESER